LLGGETLNLADFGIGFVLSALRLARNDLVDSFPEEISSKLNRYIDAFQSTLVCFNEVFSPLQKFYDNQSA